MMNLEYLENIDGDFNNLYLKKVRNNQITILSGS